MWRNAVVESSDAVESFYAQSAEKTPTDANDGQGYEAFRREWRVRREAVINLKGKSFRMRRHEAQLERKKETAML